MNDVKKVEKSIVNSLLEDLNSKQDFIYDSLVGDVTNSKLPEDIFVNRFLPFFSGKELPTKDSSLIAEWVSVAGTPMAEVDIINSRGEKLFTVPALFDTDILNRSRDAKNGTFKDIYNDYELRKASVPTAANHFLDEKLTEKINTIGKTPDNFKANSDKWDAVFNRYGIVNEKQVKKEVLDNSGSEDLLYE